jgi:hypothetical protein
MFLRGTAGIGLNTTIKSLRRSASGVAENGLRTTATYLRGAANIGLGTAVKDLRRATSAIAGNGLGSAIKCIVNQKRGYGQQLGQCPLHTDLTRIQLNPPVVQRLL